ncbi:MAG TPA: histidine kinase N-terminal 7TM domain-containing protein [Armatimonadota bacterium]|jgi:PAS domain S-box-containing protein
MALVHTPYLLPLLLSVAVLLTLAVLAWHRRPAVGAVMVTLFMLSAAVWSLAYAVELVAPTLSAKLLCVKFEYLGIIAVPVCWCVFVLQYCGYTRSLRYRLPLLIVPAMTLAITMTNWHGLLYQSSWLDTSEAFPMLEMTYGPWFWVHVTYSYLLIAFGTACCIAFLVHMPRAHRGQGYILLVSAGIPWIADILYIWRITPLPHFDLTPIAFAISAIVIFLGLFRFHLLDVRPIARAAVLMGMLDGVIVLDRQGRLVDLNPAAGRVLGGDATALIGQSAATVLAHWPALLAHLETETEIRLDIALQVEGSARDYEVRLSPLHSARGHANGHLLVLRDQSERKQAETALRASEARFAQFMEHIPAAIFIKDAASRYLYVNAYMRRFYGWDDDCLGRATHEVFPADYATLRCINEHRAIAEGLIINEEESTDTQGRVRTFETCRFPIHRSDGQTLVGGFALDVTELRASKTERAQLVAQLQQAQKMEAIGRLAGGIAHDFNNLLMPMLGYAELLRMRVPDDSPFVRPIEAIQDAAQRAATLTRQLLAFSRKQVLETRVLDLSAVVAEFSPMLHRLIGEDVTLTTKLPMLTGRIQADPSQLQQILMNLAVNARDAMPDGGTLSIETADVTLEHALGEVPPGDYATLFMRDTGLGMDADTLSHVFEPFFTTKAQGKGTGLGLSTVYGLVTQHNGYITAESTPGQGSTFTVFLHRVQAAIALEDTASLTAPVPAGCETVLLVEDEAMVRTLVCDVLATHGYRVLVAEHGDAALAIAQHHQAPIALLLTDVIMPGMNGRELAERLIALHPETAVLYMSGYPENVISQHGILDPGLHFLPKPFSVLQLTQTVYMLIQRHARGSTA